MTFDPTSRSEAASDGGSRPLTPTDLTALAPVLEGAARSAAPPHLPLALLTIAAARPITTAVHSDVAGGAFAAMCRVMATLRPDGTIYAVGNARVPEGAEPSVNRHRDLAYMLAGGATGARETIGDGSIDFLWLRAQGGAAPSEAEIADWIPTLSQRAVVLVEAAPGVVADALGKKPRFDAGGVTLMAWGTETPGALGDLARLKGDTAAAMRRVLGRLGLVFEADELRATLRGRTDECTALTKALGAAQEALDAARADLPAPSARAAAEVIEPDLAESGPTDVEPRAATDDEIEALRAEVAAQQTQIAAREAEIADLRAAAAAGGVSEAGADVEKQIQSLTRQRDTFKSNAEKRLENMMRLREEARELRTALNQATRTAETLEQELAAARERIAQLEGSAEAPQSEANP